MGRRKIEIRAIKDDRNRSVTFLKRKGGLFKKAHELSVLCSVDVAIIIFGHNKKLYEFSSGSIEEILRRYQYYGQPHEHKGPNDFKNRGGDDDDDDEDEDEDIPVGKEESLPPQHNMLPQHIQQHTQFAHIRAPPQASVSPPMPNGIFQARHSTPQPGQMGSRPSSRNMIRRSSSNLVPMHPHPTPPPPQNGFAYVPNPPIYNPQTAPGHAPQPSPQPQYQQFPPPPPPPPPPSIQHHPQQQHHPQHHSHQPPIQPQHQQHQHHHHQHIQPHPPQPPSQLQQQQQQPLPPPPPPPPTHQPIQLHPQPPFGQDQRRLSQPPIIRHDSLQPSSRPPPPHTSPRPEQQSLRPPEHSSPPQPKHLSSKSRSIFTPIDEGGSVLAQHFFGAPDPQRSQGKKDISPDLRPPPRNVSVPIMPTVPRAASQPAKPASTAAEFPPPSRTDTSGSKSGARPKLNLQIPSEASDDESQHGGSPHQSAGPSANSNRGPPDHIVLPPPSPSASAVLSAGASGPPNPFARPPPPTSNQNRDAYQENRNNIDTPISALPSRYMNNDLLPSPSNFFSEWGDFGRNSAILPSPLNFPTPADARPPGFGRSESDTLGEKRKGSIGEREGDAKKVKT